MGEKEWWRERWNFWIISWCSGREGNGSEATSRLHPDLIIRPKNHCLTTPSAITSIIIISIMIIAFCTSQHRNLRSYHKARHWILILWIIGKTFCHRENVSAILPPDSHLSSCQPQRRPESLHFLPVQNLLWLPPQICFVWGWDCVVYAMTSKRDKNQKDKHRKLFLNKYYDS